MDAKKLIRAAIEARKNAYAPYSHYAVGAALLAEDGRIYTGCNIENAAYGPSNCAERTAVFKAVSEGERSFAAIAIVGGPENGALQKDISPCGVCRQVLNEFCGPDFAVLLACAEDEYRLLTLAELLPFSFGSQNVRSVKP